MKDKTFKALVIEEIPNKKFQRKIKSKSLDDLPKGDVLINVKYSSLNYKDALSASGNKGVTKNYPHTPGIDAAGIVIDSTDPQIKTGEEVLVTGFDLGMNTSGGFAQYIRVPSKWVITLPEGLTLRECMIYGTAGFTAALSLLKLEQNGLNTSKEEILVTGATGGVGSMAVAILAKIGYRVTAATGKMHKKEYLLKIGAQEVIHRDEINDASDKALFKQRWAGVVDTVGGPILTTALKSTQFGGSVTCCGLVASHTLNTTLFPFILRGVNLLGIASAETPIEVKREVWQKISKEWKVNCLNTIAEECSLEALSEKIDAILKGELKGRIVVNLDL